MKQKIILAVTNDLTYDQRMQRICRSLCKAGYVVQLIGRQLSSSVPLKEEPFTQTRLKCLFNKGKLFYTEYNIRLFCYLLSQKADAFCAVDLDTIVPVYVAGKLKGAKLIYDAHEYFTEVPEVVRRPLVKKIWQWVERTFVPRFHLAYTVSQGLSDLFSSQFLRPFHVIRNVPYQRKLPMVKKQEPGYLLYQGALNEGRGLENLLEAMPQLPVKLKLAGEGDLSASLREKAKALYLENKVEFLGFLSPDKLREVTDDAYIGINLLEPVGKSYYYSLANKFFDYIQSGVPQICIDFPEYRHLNRQYKVAVLVKNTSVCEIKSAVERLLNDKSLYSQLQLNNINAAAQLNWQIEEQKLLTLYHELLG
jgi:glycosyltransferase involved in cell wall biosynthesis